MLLTGPAVAACVIAAGPPTAGPGKTLGSGAAGEAEAVPAPSPRPYLPTTNLPGPSGVVDLCDSLRAEDRMTFAGNAVAQARARDEHRKLRLSAAGANYAIDVPAAGFSFKGYDLPNQRLLIDTERGFVVGDGVQIAGSVPDGEMDFEAAPDPADAMLKAHAGKHLVLRLVFRPGKSQMTSSPCVRPAGGGIAKLHAQVLAFDLVRPDGSVAARGETSDYADAAATATRVGEPAVTVRRPSADAGDVPEDLIAAVQVLGPPLLPCYQKALAGRPGLRGTLVIDLRAAADGSIQQPKMQVSSLGDDAMVDCVLARLGRAKLPRRPGSLRISIPIGFGGRGE